jgi:heme/copper-type cytochrome/quinol oxidase subunit 3
MSLIGVVLLIIRVFEFAHLNTRWDSDAYGSVVWVVLGLHTTHLATDLVDTIVLNVLMFTRHATPRRFSDVTDNAFYWNFVVLAWLPLYLLLYWAPRL